MLNKLASDGLFRALWHLYKVETSITQFISLPISTTRPRVHASLDIRHLLSACIKKSQMHVSKVCLSADAYLACLHHALTTEHEEVMGLLLGQFIEDKDEVVCEIFSAVTLRRSVKRKDRVEISPEMLIEGQSKAEEMSERSGQTLNIVGWYHSHPHITVCPSDVDLKTQALYQHMDNHFVGLIFSVYNEDQNTKVGTQQVTCFQASRTNKDSEPQWSCVPVPLSITPSPVISSNNQQALESLVKTLYEEQVDILKLSREKFLHCPLVHLHNSAVMVRSLCGLINSVSGPLAAGLEHQIKNFNFSSDQIQQEIDYLEKLLKSNNIYI